MGLQELPNVRDRAELGDVDDGCESAASRVRDDQVIGLQSLQRLAYRGAAHPEFGGERTVVDRTAGPNVEHDQLHFDALIAFFVLIIFWVMMGSCLR